MLNLPRVAESVNGRSLLLGFRQWKAGWILTSCCVCIHKTATSRRLHSCSLAGKGTQKGWSRSLKVPIRISCQLHLLKEHMEAVLSHIWKLTLSRASCAWECTMLMVHLISVYDLRHQWATHDSTKSWQHRHWKRKGAFGKLMLHNGSYDFWHGLMAMHRKRLGYEPRHIAPHHHGKIFISKHRNLCL